MEDSLILFGAHSEQFRVISNQIDVWMKSSVNQVFHRFDIIEFLLFNVGTILCDIFLNHVWA